jgi:hypothetical protein
MTIDTTQQNTKTHTSGLSETVLQRIEREHVGQVPKWQFTLGEYIVWLLWALSVCIGAIAFSVIIFFSVHAHFSPYEATHSGPIPFFLEVMPYAWVLVFMLMAVLAHNNLRHTKRGYKFAVWQILLSSLVVSFIGGAVLHTVGMGFKVDHLMADRVPFFPALGVLEARMWQSPGEGRVVGSFTGETESENIVVFTDVEGARWRLNTQELNARDIETLHAEKKVRVIGLMGSSSEDFYGCGVFPWMADKNLSSKELRLKRAEFFERMREHHKQMLESWEKDVDDDISMLSRCATHQTVLKLRQK